MLTLFLKEKNKCQDLCFSRCAKITASADPKILKGGKVLLISHQEQFYVGHSQLPILISGYRNFDYKKNSTLNPKLI